MAIIDYQSIRSFAFARLSLSARVLIPVLATLCDDASGLLSEADSRASALAEYSGLGERSVRSALADLVQAGVIECDRRPGRAPRIVYLPAPAVAAVSGDKAGWGVRGECRSLAPGDLWGGLGGSVDSTLRQILPDTPATVADHPGKFCRGQSDEKMPQTPDFTDEIENGKNVA